MSNYTEGALYRVYDRGTGTYHIYERRSKLFDILVAEMDSEANAQRIVDCVNGCQGINPLAVKKMYDALKELPRPKSILEDASYTGGDVPKKWINDRGFFNDGYNQALRDVAKLREQALTKAKEV